MTGVAAPEVRADPLVKPLWGRAKFWLVLSLGVLLGAVLLSLVTAAPTSPLDPRSPSKGGAKALAVLLDERGTTVTRTTSPDDAANAAGTVVVAFPEFHEPAFLERLAAGERRVVLLAPGPEVADAFGVQVTGTQGSGPRQPDCDVPGARAAGTVDFDRHITYAGPTTCYGGAVVVTPDLVVIGWRGAVRNDHLADEGVAALLLNTISADGAVRDVTWLMPGSGSPADGGRSVWALFPEGAHRAFLWLAPVALLLVLWRGRRLGPVVAEPLPVVVRAAEIVEGHGRLYRRAQARDRAAAAFQRYAARTLAARLGLPRHAPPADIAASAAPSTGWPATAIVQVLTAPPPGDDAGLVRLATDLDRLLDQTKGRI